MRYTALLHKDAHSSYGVSFPDLPGCFSGGETEEEAIRNAAEALELHLQALHEFGKGIPIASVFEVIEAKGRELNVKTFRVSLY